MRESKQAIYTLDSSRLCSACSFPAASLWESHRVVFATAPIFVRFGRIFSRIWRFEGSMFLNHGQPHSARIVFCRRISFFTPSRAASSPPELVVSSSSGEQGDIMIGEESIPFAEIVHKNDPEKFIHIPSA